MTTEQAAEIIVQMSRIAESLSWTNFLLFMIYAALLVTAFKK